MRLSDITVTVRVRKRWWVRPLLRIAPLVLSPLSRMAPRACVAALNAVVRLVESRGLVVTVVTPTFMSPT